VQRLRTAGVGNNRAGSAVDRHANRFVDAAAGDTGRDVSAPVELSEMAVRGLRTLCTGSTEPDAVVIGMTFQRCNSGVVRWGVIRAELELTGIAAFVFATGRYAVAVFSDCFMSP